MEWKNNANLKPKDFAIIHDPTDLPVSPISEITKDIIKIINNICAEFIKTYNISLDEWKKYSKTINKPNDTMAMGEIRYKDITVCTYGPDPLNNLNFLLSETWKVYKDCNDQIIKDRKNQIKELFKDSDKPFIFRGGL